MRQFNLLIFIFKQKNRARNRVYPLDLGTKMFTYGRLSFIFGIEDY